MCPSIAPFNKNKYDALMDGLECNELNYLEIEKELFRIDSEFYSKENILIETVIDKMHGKSIREYKGILDCSAFYPSITAYYNTKKEGIPFLRVNEIVDGVISITDDTVFLPEEIISENKNTIAVAYPGDIIIAKGGNTLAKVGLATMEYPKYATCRDVIILRSNELDKVNKYYLWAFLHCTYGQKILWRYASQTGQPHLTLPAIYNMKIPSVIVEFQNEVESLYKKSIQAKMESVKLYQEAQGMLMSELSIDINKYVNKLVNEKMFSESFLKSGRLDAEYYQPKYDYLYSQIKEFETCTLKELVNIKKSIEPGSKYYRDKGIPFIRVRDISIFGISKSEIKLPFDISPNINELFPREDTILYSKDGSIGIAYKIEKDMDVITSGALLHLSIKNKKYILPDYLALVLNSVVVSLQAEKDSNGAIIKHWKPSEIEKVIIPVIDMSIQFQISNLVKRSFEMRKYAEFLLNEVKQAVESIIEKGEEEALQRIKIGGKNSAKL